MKQLLLYIGAAALFLVVIGFLTRYNRGEPVPLVNQNQSETQQADTKKVTINETEIIVEVADTDEERKTGLSDRESLGENQGMLFVFDQKKTEPIFWMKDMSFPIDIIWITDSSIVKIDKNVQPPSPDTPETELEKYRPNQPVDYVLEVNAGFTEINNINEGDSIDLSGAL